MEAWSRTSSPTGVSGNNNKYNPHKINIIPEEKNIHKTITKIFNSRKESIEKGKGIAGSYNYELAEQKKAEAVAISRNNGHPLTILVEKIE